ncbi:MAG: hypothetical protein NVS9B10_18320 [Nevskia sp.]
MARQRPGIPEHHAPGQGRRRAPEFAVDEVADAAGEQADRHADRDEIRDRPERQLVLQRVDLHRDEHADQSAMKRHAALPDAEDHERIAQKNEMAGFVDVVEKRVADAAAEYHAEHAVEQHVGDAFGCPVTQVRIAAANAAQVPEPEKPEQVGNAVPAHAERTQMQGDRIEIGVNKHARARAIRDGRV